MSETYTMLDERPEVLSLLDDKGDRVKPERYALNNKIFKDYTSNAKIQELIDKADVNVEATRILDPGAPELVFYDGLINLINNV